MQTRLKSKFETVSPVVCIRARSEYVVGGCANGIVSIWEIKTQNLIWILDCTISREGPYCGSVDFNDEWLCASLGNKLIIWSMTDVRSSWRTMNKMEFQIDSPHCSKIPRHIIEKHTTVGMITTLKMDFQQGILVTCGEDGVIYVWRICDFGSKNEMTPSMELCGHEEGVRCLQTIGDRLVTGSYDHSIKIWSLSTGNCLTTIRDHNGDVNAIDCTKSLLVSASDDLTVRLRDFFAVQNKSKPFTFREVAEY
ncbi:hypothetical protein HK096_011133, partial [Nowakowskiella sp. JEL0078]